MLPITATPRVLPSRRVASLTAEPTPAFSTGTAPMMDSVAGALVRPLPVPQITIVMAIVRYVVVTVALETQRKNTARSASPVVTTSLVPRRTASLVPSTEAIATAMATGRVRTPAANGP